MANYTNASVRGLLLHPLAGAGRYLAVWAEDELVGANYLPRLYYQIITADLRWDFTKKQAVKIVKTVSPKVYRTDTLYAVPARLSELVSGQIVLEVTAFDGAIAAPTEGEWSPHWLVAVPNTAPVVPTVPEIDWYPKRLYPSPDAWTANPPTEEAPQPVTPQFPPGLVIPVAASAGTNPVAGGGPLLVEYVRDSTTGEIEFDDDGRPKIAKVGDIYKIGTLVLNFSPNYFGTGKHAWVGGGGSFSGYVYVRGNFVDLTATTAKAWVRVQLDQATAAYHEGPPPIPFPPFEAWYEVSNTFGNIVIV